MKTPRFPLLGLAFLATVAPADADPEPGSVVVEEGAGGDPRWSTSWLEVAGAKTYCLVVPSSPERVDSGVTLVMLHGAAFSVGTWQEIGTLAFMAEHGVRTVTVDLPGFGLSPGRKGTFGSAPSKADWLAVLLEQVAPGRRVVLVSPSMSGTFAVPYVEKYGATRGLVAWVPVAPVFPHQSAWELPEDVRRRVEVLAIYGELDTPKLPDADVITAAFEVSRKVIVRNGRHPCYLDNPPLFHAELLDLVRRHEASHPHVARDAAPSGMSSLLSKISSDHRRAHG